MASIYRRGTTWWIQYRVAGKNVQRSLRTTSEQIARKKKKKIDGLEVAGKLDLPSKTPMAPFLEAFCGHQRLRNSPTTYRADVSRLRSFFGPICKTRELAPKRKRPGGRGERPAMSMPPHAVSVRSREALTPVMVIRA